MASTNVSKCILYNSTWFSTSSSWNSNGEPVPAEHQGVAGAERLKVKTCLIVSSPKGGRSLDAHPDLSPGIRARIHHHVDTPEKRKGVGSLSLLLQGCSAALWGFPLLPSGTLPRSMGYIVAILCPCSCSSHHSAPLVNQASLALTKRHGFHLFYPSR